MAKRDWQADWEMCKAATPEPWWNNGSQWDRYPRPAMTVRAKWGSHNWTVAITREGPPSHCLTNARFIAEARSALPYWLLRVKELEDVLWFAYDALEDEAAKRRIREVLGIE